jgi:hypothetical protein
MIGNLKANKHTFEKKEEVLLYDTKGYWTAEKLESYCGCQALLAPTSILFSISNPMQLCVGIQRF